MEYSKESLRDQLQTNIFDYKDPNGQDLTEEEQKFIVEMLLNYYFQNKTTIQKLRQNINAFKQPNKERIWKATQYLLQRSLNKYDQPQKISRHWLDIIKNMKELFGQKIDKEKRSK